MGDTYTSDAITLSRPFDLPPKKCHRSFRSNLQRSMDWAKMGAKRATHCRDERRGANPDTPKGEVVEKSNYARLRARQRKRGGNGKRRRL